MLLPLSGDHPPNLLILSSPHTFNTCLLIPKEVLAVKDQKIAPMGRHSETSVADVKTSSLLRRKSTSLRRLLHGRVAAHLTSIPVLASRWCALLPPLRPVPLSNAR